MRVLIACETSGETRRAFAARGHDVWSCDILPADDGERLRHIQDSAQHVFAKYGWWDLVIAHPPCTRLCNSGVRWLHERDLWDEMREAAEFFLCCLSAPADRVAVENPIMHRHAREIVGRGPDFTIQPWQFGDDYKKRTCFWTRGLQPLVPTAKLDGSTAKPEVHYASPGPNRWKVRSKTYPGIAAAMAEQWGNPVAPELPLLAAQQKDRQKDVHLAGHRQTTVAVAWGKRLAAPER